MLLRLNGNCVVVIRKPSGIVWWAKLRFLLPNCNYKALLGFLYFLALDFIIYIFVLSILKFILRIIKFCFKNDIYKHCGRSTKITTKNKKNYQQNKLYLVKGASLELLECLKLLLPNEIWKKTANKTLGCSWHNDC